MKETVDFSGKVKATGRLAVACSAFAVFGILIIDLQSGGHGEMGSFYYDNTPWILLFAGWGLGTGIGLLRAWRWARISTLIFSGLLAAFGILGMLPFFRMPGHVIWRTVFVLLHLIPTASGLWWLVFFTREDVKAYFQAGR